MASINTETFRFMEELWENNNKFWFDLNRKRYADHVRVPLKRLSISLAEPVRLIAPDYIKDPKVSRINNDIRFNPKKPPYKEHMWISFNSKSAADIFFAVDRHGWSIGCGINCAKRDDGESWRRNLIEHADVWRECWDELNGHQKLEIYSENPYKKPLYDDIPEDLFGLVQARGVWFVQNARTKFEQSPEDDILRELKLFLPLYLFMNVLTNKLRDQLKKLG